MALESATYVSGLVATNPTGSDSISQGDDHLRLIKTVLKNTLPNADEAINGVHTSGSAPSPTTAGLVWFDTSTNLIKIRNEANSGWINLMASEGSRLLKTTHGIQATTSTFRSDTYVDIGWSITHTCVSSSSTLYVQVDGMNDVFSAWDGSSDHQYTYIKLANTSGTLITGTTDNILVGDIKSKVDAGLSSEEYGFGFSHLWKVTSGNRPTPDSGTTYTFDIWSKQPKAAAGGTTFQTGTMMVWEIEE
tara:strand:+ start:146 stop:889 length:744 start_codon:yes stop_codon:yes gene_type:complete